MAAIAPAPALISLAVWILLTALTKIVGLASIIAALALPVLVLVLHEDTWVLYAALIIVVLIIIAHHENIARLLRGKEKKIK